MSPRGKSIRCEEIRIGWLLYLVHDFPECVGRGALRAFDVLCLCGRSGGWGLQDACLSRSASKFPQLSKGRQMLPNSPGGLQN